MSNEYNIYTKPEADSAEPVEVMTEEQSELTIIESDISTVKEEVINPTEVIGFVSGCSKLNVRNEPNINAIVECVISALDEVEIDEAKSTNKFYKVCTESGVCGYCMKKYITIKR